MIHIQFYCTIFLPSIIFVNLYAAAGELNDTKKFVKNIFTKIHKSPEDRRSYRGYELTNGLKVFLISDPSADDAAVSMVVQSGFMNDPEDLIGLAHFCEHMVFMGTKMYPNESEFSTYMSANGGSSNAVTKADTTTFHFNIPPASLDGALQRFSQFFVSPLFKVGSTDRELSAVDSEYQNLVQNDEFHDELLIRLFSKSGTSFTTHEFGCGNKKTLPGDKPDLLHEQLIKYFNGRYSANVMTLAVLDSRDLDALADSIIPMFAALENKNITPTTWPDHPTDIQQLPKLVQTVPVIDKRNLNLYFPMPDMRLYYKTKPESYISKLLESQDPGSFIYELKRQHLATSIKVKVENQAHNFGFFIIEISLSKLGLNKYDEVLRNFFTYISVLKVKTGTPEWIYKEQQKINNVRFRFADKLSAAETVEKASTALIDYPVEETLYAPDYMMAAYNESLIQDLLTRLNIKNAIIFLVAKDFEGNTTSVEKWSQSHYTIKDLDSKLFDDLLKTDKFAEQNSQFYLPKPNKYIPEKFDQKASNVSIGNLTHPAPSIFYQVPSLIRCWNLPNNEYAVPKTVVWVRFHNAPFIVKTARDMTIANLFNDVFEDYITAYVYDATLTGLEWQAEVDHHGIYIKVYAFTDVIQSVLETILKELMNFKIDKDRFDVIKQKYVDKLDGFSKEQPYVRAIQSTQFATEINAYSNEEVLDAIKSKQNITVDDLNKFRLDINFFTEVFVYGNTNFNISQSIANIVTKTIRPKQQLIKDVYPRTVKLAIGTTYVYKLHTVLPMNAALTFLQTNLDNTHENMLAQLLNLISKSPFFEQIRTKEQLGYITQNGRATYNGVNGLLFLVQGETTATKLEERVESFLNETLENVLSNITDEEFDQYKTGLANSRLQKPATMSLKSDKYTKEIDSILYNFNRDSVEVESLKMITKKELIKFYKDYVKPGGNYRRKLAILVYSAPKLTEMYLPKFKTPVVEIRNTTEFKRLMPLFDRPAAYTNVTTL